MLAGKTALVTGGGRGIGRAIAVGLAAEGARVVVAGRTAAEIDEVAGKINGVAVIADLGDRTKVARFIDELTKIGRIDVLVNNAGISDSAPYHRTSDELWDRLMQVNVHAAFALCRALVPGMVEAGFGRVINV
ncbi:MAG: SDR family NAD(P)-dependent oxidoreductase, partial [Myxococcales bacterium]|nr:SDR family NAD(P)-dependent oxidoreductase [Myxococcales bacterium]